ncbi:FecR family protein [Chitinophaga lutea]|uniref:FecR family protein n=1 Tax=Chitinophaga lutea TaxID=2488634 RepID=A0A3N4Q8Z7_9BACT|nr:FecR family protein [Chitinophaga lutea]RPE12507.1 FecR family protein [Chitinophaga lutea]
MDHQTFSTLLDRYLRGDLSREEAARLMDSLHDEDMRRQWESAVGGLLENKAMHGLSDPARMDAVRRSIMAGKAPARQTQPILKRLIRYAAAAAVLLSATLTTVYLFRQASQNRQQAAIPVHAGALIPGGDKAILTLADGSRITLDTAGNGAIASQGNVQVIKLNSGQLAYNTDASGKGGGISYNTLSTPKGGQFRIILPDGSNVWLNAASSLRFPTAFSGKTREVQLNGEAYFEVAKNPAMPFTVKVNEMAVQVLGTHFNVMAYKDENSIQTTLLEGAVNIQHGAQAMLLKPGQQARLSAAGKMTLNDRVDVEEVTAWKNGYFHFNHESLEGVMRQIGRWYDAEVTYEGDIPAREFGGKIERSSSVTEVMKILELSKVRYRIEGKKIVITP